MKTYHQNNQMRPALRRTALTLLGGLCLAAGSLSTQAADKIWDGGGDQSSWLASPANWDLDAAPAASDRLFFGGSVGLAPNNDFAANTVFANLTFNPGAGAFTLGGNAIKLASGSGTLGGVTNLSSVAQTINFQIDNNGGPRVYNALSNDIVITKNINNSTLVKEGPYTVTLATTANDSSLAATVNEGTLVLAGTVNNCLGSTLTINANGTVRLVGSISPVNTDQIHFNQRIIMNGGKFQQQHLRGLTNPNTLEEIGALSGSNPASIVENGQALSTNRLDIGGGSNHRGIYSGTIRDGAAGVMALQVYRNNNFQQFNGTNTYTGATLINNTAGTGAARYIMNGAHLGDAITSTYTVTANQPDRFAYINGNGVISASVINLNANAIIAPGGSLSADLSDSATFADSVATLTISNAVNLNTSTAMLELEFNGNNPGVTYDRLVIAGSGTISNNNGNLKVTLGYTPAAGDKFTIVDVEGTDSAKTMGTFGSFNGVALSMAQGAIIVDPNTGQSFRISYRAEGSTFDMGAGLGNNIMLEAISPVGGAQIAWRGDLSSDWDITTTANWRLAGNVASIFANADFVTFDNSGSNAQPVNLTTDLTPATININTTNNYEFGGAGKLTGLVIITKTNTGKLTITTDNDNSGAILHRQGVIQVGTNGTSGLLSGNVSMTTNSTLIFNRSDASTFAGVISGAGTVINNSTNGTISLTANSSFTGGILANAGTLQFGDGTGVSGSVAGRVTNNAVVAYNFNNAVTIANSLSGTGQVNLINASGTSRRFNFPTTLQSSTFSGTFNVGPLVNLGTADGSTGTNQLGIGSVVYVEDGGSVLLDRSGNYRTTFYIQGTGNGAGNAGTPVSLEIEGISPPTTIHSNVYVLSSTTIGGFIGTSRILGQIIDTNGTSTLTFANGRGLGTSFILQVGSASGPNHWGDTVIDPDLSGGVFNLTAMAPNAISTNGLTLGAHGNFLLNGNSHTVGKLASSTAGGAILNGAASTPAVLTVGADGTSTAFDGVFGNGGAAALGVTKVGGGTLVLSGSSSNTGPVTINEGGIQLSLDGSFSNATLLAIGSAGVLDVTTRTDGSLNLNAGQTLIGNGGLNGNLVTAPGSTVNPGASIGTLTVSNNATLAGNLVMEVNRTAVPNSDALVVTGTLTAGGTLSVTNIGAALQANDTFQLFPAGVAGFTVNLPTYDTLNARQYTWQNNVGTLGSVKVLTSVAIAPPTMNVAQAGNALTFTWSGPFKLQAQTNSLAVGIGSTWVDFPGGATSPVNVTINPANPTVFFRLSLQ